MSSIADELRASGPREAVVSQSQKKNYAEALSRALAQTFANKLRPAFPGILPGPDGQGQESKARTAKGFKKLDVNYSTLQLGLALGVSIKTINFKNKDGRYKKNFTRVDNELRAEAADYHVRQPYAVMIGVLFLPSDAYDDATLPKTASSFGDAVKFFRNRSNRAAVDMAPDLFERFFVGTYELEPKRFGEASFFDVMEAPPKSGRPSKMLSFDDLIGAIIEAYDSRNSPPFKWAEGEVAEPSPPSEEFEGDED